MCAARSLFLPLSALLLIAPQPEGLFAQTPLGSPVLTVDDGEISWTAVDSATGYDLLRGDLGTLRQSGGDFTAATRRCLADDSASPRISYGGVPKPGEAFWFLVRAVTPTQAGSFDSDGAGQVGSRDAEIEAAPSACFSPVAPHAPIAINGNAGFTAANGVGGGSGTIADPFLIAGWDIVCPSMNNTAGIQIFNTTLPFLIRNVRAQSCHYGTLLSSTRNGRIERSRAGNVVHGVRMSSTQDSTIEGFRVSLQTGSGIDVGGSTNVIVKGNTLDRGFVGINLDGASGCAVHHNDILGNTLQAIDQRGGVNAWDDGYPAGGNYWTNYQGGDQCGGPAQNDCTAPDGFGDTPYMLNPSRADRYPRMAADFAEGDGVPPTVAIASPLSGSVFTTTPQTVSGTAADVGSGVKRVELSLNGGPWTVATGTSPWSLSVGLAPGPNTIQARSLDHAGNVSTTAALAVTYDAPIWEAVVQTSKATYLPGEPVGITFRLTNRSAFPVTLHFSTTCEAFFRVVDAFGAPVYDLGQHQACFFIFTQRTWQPNETATYNFTWTQVTDAGQQVPVPADYEITGYMLSSEEVPDGVGAISVVPGT